MSSLLTALRQHAASRPESPALSDGSRLIGYAELAAMVGAIADRLNSEHRRSLGLLADNGIAWVCADLAALTAGIALVPLPLFFSPQQLLHTIQASGMDALLTDHPAEVAVLLSEAGVRARLLPPVPELDGLQLLAIEGVEERAHRLPSATCKVTFTSGTTGAPKGVCLGAPQIAAVAESLRAATQAQGDDRHICLTPLSTLLENIGGVYVPLLAGACSFVLPLAQVGLKGASGHDPTRMLAAMREVAATSAIMVPQMLQGMLRALNQGATLPGALRFIAVGGAPVSTRLLTQAAALGVPVYEGYGLSECASVVALNVPGAARAGSVGRPLPHLELSFGDDQEILVSGAGFLGYIGEPAAAATWPTGDTGYLDAEGYLHLLGRKKNMFITSFGRNVAPEWIERELTVDAAVAQCVVFGESLPSITAVITPAAGAVPTDIDRAIASANRQLPDYARVARWLVSQAPFSISNQQLTANGRPRRTSIWAAYCTSILPMYQEEADGVL